MGCSASRSSDFITEQHNPISIASSSHWNSPCNSLSEPSSTPASRTRSLLTPLVHHPPLKKGDSSHFVALTSTTYGSLLLDSDNQASHMRKTQESMDSDEFSSPDSVINTWELMEGLDENEYIEETMNSYEFIEHRVSKPLWKHLSEESLLAKMDDNVVSSYRNALMRKPLESSRYQKNDETIATVSSNNSDESCSLLHSDDTIVLYYTSLRSIRKTYEDCCEIRSILTGFRVCVDERDISMDRSYRTELQEALKGENLSLPQVFMRGKYIGGAEVIKQLNEDGDLAKLLEGFPLIDVKVMCVVCGNARFVPCSNCNGSRKVYEEEDGVRSRCGSCNENGLVRCSRCRLPLRSLD